MRNLSTIELLYQNVRGLRTKLQEFRISIATSNSDLFAITETGCSESIQDAEIIPPGYHIVRCDRADGRKQGGACLVATHRFKLRRVPTPGNINIDSCSFEIVCVTVHIHERFLFLCCVVYIPPRSPECEYMTLFGMIEQLCDEYSRVVVVGDFNMYSASSTVNNYYEYFVTYCDLIQNNKVPNCLGRQLDLVLSSAACGLVEVVAADEGLVPADRQHPPLAARLPRAAPLVPPRPPPPPPAEGAPKWNFFKADFELLYSMLASADWCSIYATREPEEVVNRFYETVYGILDGCVPRKKLKRGNALYSYPEWYTHDIIRDIKLKAYLHKKYKKSRLNTDYEAFSVCRASVKVSIAEAYNQYCKQLQSRFAKDPKSFWKYIRSLRKSEKRNSIIRDGIVLSDQECAREFALFFESVYSTQPAKLDVRAAVERGGAGSARVHLPSLSLEEVRAALARLKPKISAGPDGIPAFLLRDCGRVLADPLHYIFNVCMERTTFPAQWKTTRVIPVPKGSVGSEVSGYRPVAVLSSPAKVFESAIQRAVFAATSAALADAQHGFRPARSTTTNLLNFVNCVGPAVDSGVQVDVAYFDFRKAFDTVDNDILMEKLARVGFTPHLLQFFASYMSDRQQYVDYNGYESEPYFTRSGISQGSNLGPLEFILMINDLPDVTEHGTCLLFADDLKLFLAVKDNADCERLQSDINKLVKWSHENKLYFNVSKCSVLTYTKAHRPLQHQYTIESVPMERVTEVRDLGVVFSGDLNFRDHITKICKKAFRNLGFMMRQTRGFTSIAAVKALYDALVRSHLEYNSVVWAPHENKYRAMLERVQNKFTRHLYKRLYGVYPFYPLMYPTLFVLGMVGYNKLEVRRDSALAEYVWKLLRGVTHNPLALSSVSLSVPDDYVRRRRRPRLLAVPRARTNLLAKAPFTRALLTLNEVAERIDLFSCHPNEFAVVTLHVASYVTLG